MMESVSDADLTVLYGSQTGNAEFLAYNISEKAKQAGMTTELLTLNDALNEENLMWQRLLLVTSTHDNGHMPENADAFWAWLQACEEEQYLGLPYAVLTIGDSMYEDFCKAGRDFDIGFARLGATPMLDRKECDVDYDMTSAPWIKKFLAAAAECTPWSPPSSTQIDTGTAQQFRSELEDWHSAEITALTPLSSPQAAKRAFRLELRVPDGFSYLPGDSLDIKPLNNEKLVDEWMAAFPDAEELRVGDETMSVREALTTRVELRLPHIGFVNSLLTQITSSEAADRIKNLLDSGDRQQIDEWMWGRDVLDVARELGFTGRALQPLIDMMRPLQYRSYSIASTPLVAENRLSLVVSSIEYESTGRRHYGTGSSYLEGGVGTQVAVRRVVAHNFRLPEEEEAPLIMIGPGVGVAPFIGFLEEIEARGGEGESWLFFGNQHRTADWLYEEEMTRWLESGVLSNLSLAFSRDQAEKHYVQHDILTHAAEVREWVDRGAHIFICGDKNQMAHDVEDALTRVLGESATGFSRERGAAALESLRAAGRYAKDVY